MLTKGKTPIRTLVRHILPFIGFFFISTSVACAANSSVRENLISASNIKSSGEYTFSHCRPIQGEPFAAKPGKKKALIIGDSHACDFLNSVLENGYLQDYQIRLRFIPYRCQTVFGTNAERFIDRKDRAFCDNPNRADTLENAQQQAQEADLVIFASRWKPNIARALPTTIRDMGLKPSQNVVVIGSKFFGKMSIRKYLHMEDSELKQLRNEVGTASQKVNDMLEKGLGNGIVFVDQHELVCGEATTCPVFTDDMHLISYDGRHLTRAGARYVGKVLFEKSELGQM